MAALTLCGATVSIDEATRVRRAGEVKMQQRSSNRARAPFSVTVIPSSSAEHLDRDHTGRFEFRLPQHWQAPVNKNPFAPEAERQVLEWFAALGCSEAELKTARRCDVAGYVGFSYPLTSPAKTTRIAKYLSLWLLWDDVHVETLTHRWWIDAADVLARSPPDGMTRFDEGWWQLMQELAAERTPRWIEELCRAMATWSEAAADEAAVRYDYFARGVVPTFERQLELRIATIGMYAMVSMLEDAYDFELPEEFHSDARVLRLKLLANELVGIGNDVLSFGKEYSECQLNLVMTLMHERGLSVEDAIERLLRMHDDAVEEYDRIADDIIRSSTQASEQIARWLQNVRFASIGFSRWEAQAPRYTAYKVVSRGGVVIEPDFRFM